MTFDDRDAYRMSLQREALELIRTAGSLFAEYDETHIAMIPYQDEEIRLAEFCAQSEGHCRTVITMFNTILLLGIADLPLDDRPVAMRELVDQAAAALKLNE